MRRIDLIMAVFLLFYLSVAFAITTPEGPTGFNATNSSRRIEAPATSFEAKAGNITEVLIQATTQSQTWAGFVGNISGIITLDDETNKTLFDWTMTRPMGEVYASESTITWDTGNIKCYNYSHDDGSYLSVEEYETTLGIGVYDADGVNETFLNNRTHDSFYAAGNFINGNESAKTDGPACPAVSLYTDAGQSDDIFQEVLLYDLTSNKPVYTSLIERDVQTGFNVKPWDFEMIVGVDGHNGSTATKTYYFYVELGP
ncbi:MAG: hypothetical protein KJ709_02125 [Nanoarchaeota archaeon]|nr:hypothetical protein [Nanoarchaeota archaeon]